MLAWRRRPGNRIGLLLAGAGMAWFATGLGEADEDVLHSVGVRKGKPRKKRGFP